MQKMEIKIMNIKIENFKGIKAFELAFNGEDILVFGDNRTGKTTIVDAFTWCLFGKNSQWLSDTNFKIRPLDSKGNPIHNLEISVEVVLAVDGEKIVLKRVSKERWKTIRGGEPELAGNETEFFVNGVPKKAGEYKETIDSIVSEDLFKAITSPVYFNDNIGWQDRRNVLFKLIKSLNYQDILRANAFLAPLANEFEALKNEANVEDAILKKYRSIKKESDDKLKEIPTRIDELLKTDYSAVKVLTSDAGLQNKKTDISNKIVALKNSTKDEAATNLKVELKEERMKESDAINAILDEVQKNIRNIRQEQAAEVAVAREAQSKYAVEVGKIKGDIEGAEYQIGKNKEKIDLFNKDKSALLVTYREIKARTFDTAATKCDKCGQTLPKDQIEELEKSFNEIKANDIESNIAAGSKLKTEIEKLIAANDELEATIEKLKEKLASVGAPEVNVETKISEIEARYAALIEKEEARKQELILPHKNALESIDARLANVDKEVVENANESEIRALEGELEAANKLINDFQAYKNQEARKQELEKEEKEWLIIFENAEKMIGLIGDFVEIKSNMVESEVNKHFKLVEFKLFHKNLNGSIENTCIATVNGVPFNDLNHAMQINAGLDIINTLQEIYNVKAPIFIDNAEAITKYIELNSQVIKMYVKPQEKPTLEYYAVANALGVSAEPEVAIDSTAEVVEEDEDPYGSNEPKDEKEDTEEEATSGPTQLSLF